MGNIYAAFFLIHLYEVICDYKIETFSSSKFNFNAKVHVNYYLFYAIH